MTTIPACVAPWVIPAIEERIESAFAVYMALPRYAPGLPLPDAMEVEPMAIATALEDLRLGRLPRIVGEVGR